MFRKTFEHAAVGLAQVAPDGQFLEINERFCTLLGYSRDDLLGTTFQAITHPADIVEGVSKAQEILTGAIPDFSIEKRYLHKDGHTIWADLTVSLVRDKTGAPEFLIAVVEDITTRKRAEEAARAKVAELETLVETVPAAVWFTHDPQARLARGNRFASELLEIPPGANHSLSAPKSERPTHLRFLSGGIELAPEDLPLQRAARGEEVRDVELEVELSNRRSLILLDNATPLRDSTGHVIGAVNAAIDITTRKQVEQALRESETRLRLALHAGRLGVWELDPTTQTLLMSETCLTAPVPSNQETSTYEALVRSLHPSDRAQFEEAITHTLATGGDLDVVYRVVSADGRICWISMRGKSVSEGGRRKLVGVVTDITQRREAEMQRAAAEHQELLVRELNHRIANLFTIVQTIVRLTARSHPEARRYEAALLDRLQSLSATQSLLGRDRTQSALLEELVCHELSPYQDADRFISVEGPMVRLEGSRAEGVSLILHELATNAAKYGALSVGRGHLKVSWRLQKSAGGLGLILQWVEHGGPPVAAPTQRGFGSTVIEKSVHALVGGRAEADYRPEGLSYTLEVPLTSDAAGSGSVS
jgi:PAS domain S-box-containing protein